MGFEQQPVWQKAWKEYSIRLERQALKWGLLSESQSLTPFVIFTFQRFGSNMLVSMLNQHPHVRCFGELFSFQKQLLFNVDGFRRLNVDKNLLKLRDNKPAAFVSEMVKQLHPKRIKSCGFKLFYNQPKKDRGNFLKRLLAENFHFIHLKRENLLAAYTSKQMALSTGVWIGKNNDSAPNSIYIDREDFETYLYQMRFHDKEIKKLVQPEKLFEITYEELTAGQREPELLDFLSLEHRTLTSKTKKQRKRKLCELIENYDELKKYYKDREEYTFFK